MANATTVGVHDHKIHMPIFGVSSRILINKATPVAMNSTRTEKMAALFVSVSFVNIYHAPFISYACDIPAGPAYSRKGPFFGLPPSSRTITDLSIRECRG